MEELSTYPVEEGGEETKKEEEGGEVAVPKAKRQRAPRVKVGMRLTSSNV